MGASCWLLLGIAALLVAAFGAEGSAVLPEGGPGQRAVPGAGSQASPARRAQGAWTAADARALVAQADLDYAAPVGAPVEGQPIGNGRMGTLVWTTPGAIRFQINRVDVFPVNREHQGEFMGPTDICGACAQVSVEVGGEPFAPGPAFRQHLSLYDAEATVAGQGVAARCFVSSAHDLLVIEVDDQRPEPQPLKVSVSLWGPPEVVSGGHTGRYALSDRDGRALAVREFREGGHFCASAVAAYVAATGVRVERPEATTRTLVVPSARGRRRILVSSAASRQSGEDAASEALRLTQAHARSSYGALSRSHARWWAGFWSRTFVRLESADGGAQRAQQARTLHLYTMASTSRGAYPPKWNGSLFSVEGDARRWGSQFWVWTMEMAYFPLLAADAVDLTDPFFDMYVAQAPAAAEAARQRWGAAGLFYPETTPFDGATLLPEDAARDFREVFHGKRPLDSLAPATRDLCRFESHLSMILYAGKQGSYGRFSWISHVVSSGAELAAHAWWRYRYTGDAGWLRSHAYPLLRGTAEFYRSIAVRGSDGLRHLEETNVHEDFWGVRDSIMDLAAIRGTLPLAIRAAEVLGVDADLRSAWSQLLAELAPYPAGSDPDAKALAGGVLADDVWAAGRMGEVPGQHNPEDVWLTPVFPFEDWTLETRDPGTDAIVRKLLDVAPRHRSVLRGEGINTAIRTPIAVARAGRRAELSAALDAYSRAFPPMLPNGMSLFEGPTAHSVEHLGLLATTLQEALLQSVSPHPGEPEVIHVFPAMPPDWSGSFRLLARGGFLVTSSCENGTVGPVEIQSRLGEECRLRNPWGGPCTIRASGGRRREVAGDILRFPTRKGVRYRIACSTRSR